MKLLRAHGLGNDYLVLEDGPPMTSDLVRALCDRHTGVGSDGILEPTLPVGADYGVRIWNPDGSIAEKSGNGLRIFARWLSEIQGAADRFSIWTGHDVVRCAVDPEAITVAMGRAKCHTQRVSIEGRAVDGVEVNVGNPHFVVFVPTFDTLDWRRMGAALETHDHFPNRTNVQFAKVVGPRTIEARIWERGAGETQASGSSSCAIVAAASSTHRIQSGIVDVNMPGGSLSVTVDAELNLTLRGPVELVARVELTPAFAARIQRQNERE